VLTPFSTVIRATSTVTAAASNNTIDRSYTGFVRLDKTATVANAIGVCGPRSCSRSGNYIRGHLHERLQFRMVMRIASKLDGEQPVINEDGSAAPNNWGTYTTNSGSPAIQSGVVATVNATTYTDTVASLAGGASATFTFKRSIN